MRLLLASPQTSSAVPTEITAISIGARAARLLVAHADWTVAATFERSFYLRSGDAFVCAGDASIGDGPLNAVLCAGPRLTCEPGAAATSSGECLEFPDGSTIRFDVARRWQAPAWPTRPVHFATLQELNGAALREAPAESIIHALIGSTGTFDPLAERARRGLRLLGNAVGGAGLEFGPAGASLLGLGHGLTPGGDDVLSGALITLYALGRAEPAAALAASVRQQMRALTAPLSCAFLEAACDGEANAVVHRALAALIEGAVPDDVITPLATLGHASGFDILAGILIAAEATYPPA